MFDKLKRLFVVSDEEFKEAQGGSNKSTTNTSNSPNSQPQTPSSPSSLPKAKPLAGSANPKFLNILLGAVEKHNIDGFDYLEFKQSLQNLSDISMDERTKYSSAMAMAKTMGATSQSISDSANHYLQILKAEEDKFKKALAGQQQKIDSDKTIGLDGIAKEISIKKEEIERLKKEIVELERRQESMHKDINASAAKIQETNDHFSHAYSLIVQQIIDDIKKLNQYTS